MYVYDGGLYYNTQQSWKVADCTDIDISICTSSDILTYTSHINRKAHIYDHALPNLYQLSTVQASVKHLHSKKTTVGTQAQHIARCILYCMNTQHTAHSTLHITHNTQHAAYCTLYTTNRIAYRIPVLY